MSCSAGTCLCHVLLVPACVIDIGHRQVPWEETVSLSLDTGLRVARPSGPFSAIELLDDHEDVDTDTSLEDKGSRQGTNTYELFFSLLQLSGRYKLSKK